MFRESSKDTIPTQEPCDVGLSAADLKVTSDIITVSVPLVYPALSVSNNINSIQN